MGLAWHTIGIYRSAISAFLEPHCIHKASNHPVISRLMRHFYLQCPPSRKQFDPYDVECLLSQRNAAIFFPLSGGKTDCPGHLPPQIRIESHSNVNLCPVFYLKAYLRRTESFRKKPDGSRVTSVILGNNRQHRPVCAKTISSWVRKVLGVAKAHMSLGSLQGLLPLQP